MTINTALQRWTLLFDEITNNSSYSNASIYAIKPLLLDSHNRLYISENIDKRMIIYVEFENAETIKRYTFPNLKGVTLSLRSDVVLHGREYFKIEKDIECPEELFISLSISIMEMLSNTNSDISSILGIDEILKQYSNMFTKKYASIGKEAEQGLYCELKYLEELIDQIGDEAIKYWTGPEKNKHDFVFDDNKAIEVKSTSNEEQLIVHISNENQLDIGNMEQLMLYVYVVEINAAGETVVDIANRIISKISSPDRYLQFIADLALLKIDLSIYTSDYRFSIFRQYVFNVDSSFPKISKEMISTKIFDVKYKLNLSEMIGEPEE